VTPDPAVRAAYDALYVYTMGRKGFILQHVVDAFGAQTATAEGTPIRLVFSLVGLYLYCEKGRSGSEVQRVHMQLGRRKRDWPAIALPRARGDVTALDVMRHPEGDARDRAIGEWCRSVWSAFHDSRPVVVGLLKEYGIE
jgi:hypothetical protein